MGLRLLDDEDIRNLRAMRRWFEQVGRHLRLTPEGPFGMEGPVPMFLGRAAEAIAGTTGDSTGGRVHPVKLPCWLRPATPGWTSASAPLSATTRAKAWTTSLR